MIDSNVFLISRGNKLELEKYPSLTSSSRTFFGIAEINVPLTVMSSERLECDGTVLTNFSPPRAKVKMIMRPPC